MSAFISHGKAIKTYCTLSLLKHFQGKHPKDRAVQESKKVKAEQERNNQVTKKQSVIDALCLAKTQPHTKYPDPATTRIWLGSNGQAYGSVPGEIPYSSHL